MHWTCSKHESTWDSPLPSKPWQPQAISLLAAGQEQKHGQVPPNHKTCYLTVISCSAEVLMAQMRWLMAMPETELSRTAGLCPQKPCSSALCPSLEAQDFHQGILQDVFFGLLNSLLITFVNIAFFFHMSLSKANLERVSSGAQQSHNRDIVQSLEISVL